MTTIEKPKSAKLDYSVDWSNWMPTGDSIAASTWTVDAGIEHCDEDGTPLDTVNDNVCTVWLAGGSVGYTYAATNQITTVAGRICEYTIKVTVIPDAEA